MKLDVYYRGTKLGYINTNEFGYDNSTLIYNDNGQIVRGGWTCANGWDMHFCGLEVRKIGYGKNAKYYLKTTTSYNIKTDMFLLYIAQDTPDPKYKNWYEPKIIIEENYDTAINRLAEIETFAQGHWEVKYGCYNPDTITLYNQIVNDYKKNFPKMNESVNSIHWAEDIEINVKK